MDQQETQELAQDIQEEVAPQPESPFADSPYEMNCQSQSMDAETLQPAEKPKKKAAKKSTATKTAKKTGGKK